MTGLVRKVLNLLRVGAPVAKAPDPLIKRADKAIADDDVRIVVVTKADLRELRRYQATARQR